MKWAGSALPGPVPAGWTAALLEVGVRRVTVWSRTDEQKPEEDEGEQGYPMSHCDMLLEQLYSRTDYITIFTFSATMAVSATMAAVTAARTAASPFTLLGCALGLVLISQPIQVWVVHGLRARTRVIVDERILLRSSKQQQTGLHTRLELSPAFN